MTTKRRWRHTPEQIVRKLRDADAMLYAGKEEAAVLQALEVSQATYDRWRKQYGGMKAEEARRLEELEEENKRLKEIVAEKKRVILTTTCTVGDTVVIDGEAAERLGLAGKPAPDSFLAAAGALGVDPRRAAVFEDAIAGVEAGRAGGFGLVVGVNRGQHRRDLLEHGADLVVADLSELLECQGA